MSGPDVFEDGEFGILWEDEYTHDVLTEDNPLYEEVPGEDTWDN